MFAVKDSASSLGVGEMEITPVSKAIARHLGIDLTPEGKAARNRRGIAVIVNGAPQSGKIIQKWSKISNTLNLDYQGRNLQNSVINNLCFGCCQAHWGLPVGFLLLQYSVLFTVESLSLLYLLFIS